MEANTARYESDRANMQAVFTNAVSKVMAKNQATVSVSPGQINTITGGQKEAEGEVAYTLTDAQNASNATGTIVFDKGDNTDTVFYTGKKLPIYAAGETKWYVDEEGNISLEVSGTKYGNGEVIKPSVTLISGPEFNNIIPKTTKSIEFLNSAAPEGVETIDVSEEQNGSILAWLDGTTFYIAPKKAGEVIYANQDCSKMFNSAIYDGEIYESYLFIETIKFDNFNTSEVIDMSEMFLCVDSGDEGNLNTTLIGIENWDTSNVINMYSTFFKIAQNNNQFSLDLSNWDVSNVENMTSMFSNVAYWANELELIGLGNWDVSNVENMTSMFSECGYNDTDWNIESIYNWNTSKVKDMSNMFYCVGYNFENFDLNLSNWNVSNVEKMTSMFSDTGENSNTYSLNLSNWNVSNVTDMRSMFYNSGSNATTWEIIGLDNWETNSLKDLANMFYKAALNATSFKLDLSGWNVSNVIYFNEMFYNAGNKATEWSVGDISNWNLLLARNMYRMFYMAGVYANYTLDLSKWECPSVTFYTDFDAGVESKIIAPWD